MNNKKLTMEKLVSLCKRRGFIFSGSDIYWWFSNSYTYGPYWSELKNNVKKLWWKTFVHERLDMTGIDWPILLHPKTWEASGHTSNFNDALVDCKDCKARIRADHLIEDQKWLDPEWLPCMEMTKIIEENKLTCPKCWSANLTDVRNFNLMFETQLSKTWESSSAYLRPETAQAIFTEFKNIIDSQKVKLPFWVAQIWKAFRNEITPGNFTFRLLEFEQMEIEYFIEESTWENLFEKWLEDMKSWCSLIWLSNDNLKDKEHADEKLSHYSKRTIDIEYNFPFWFKELYGLAYRTDFDLSQHEKHSWKELKYRDPITNEKFVPHVIEPTFWLDRTILALLCESYDEVEDDKAWTRVVMRFKPQIAPIKLAILPLQKKLREKSMEIFKNFSKYFYCDHDEVWSIWKRYARQDEIWTPYCVTIDFDTTWSWENCDKSLLNTVTVRDRDSQKQERIKIEDLRNYIDERINW